MYGVVTFFDRSFQNVPLHLLLAADAVLQPPNCLATTRVWASARSLATTCAITIVFFSCGYLDVSVPHVRLPLTGCQAFNLAGCPIRISRYQRLFAPTPGFSQLITSFIASESQGIHRLPFFTFLLYVRFFLQICISQHVKDLLLSFIIFSYRYKLRVLLSSLSTLSFSSSN